MATLPGGVGSFKPRPVATSYKYNNTLPTWVQPADPSRDSLDRAAKNTPEDRQSTFNAEGGVLPIIYGEQRVGSKIFAVGVKSGYLYLGCAFCEGPIDAIVALEVNDLAWDDTTYAGNITVETYLGSQTTASPMLTTVFGASYTDILVSTEVVAGVTHTHATAYAVVKIKADTTGGFPNVTAQIRGMKVYDPRDGNQIHGDKSTYVWSNNPALCLADLINEYTYGLNKDVVWHSVEHVANKNDQLIGIPEETSRILNIVIDTQQHTTDWIETVRGYVSCFVVPSEDGYELIYDGAIGFAFNSLGTTACFVDVPYVAAHNFTNEFSIQVSVKPDASGTGEMTILSKGSDYSLTYLPPTTGAGTLTLYYTDTATGVQSISVAKTLSTTAMTSISVSLRKTGGVLYCFDGVWEPLPSAITSSTVAVQTSTDHIFIGKLDGGGTPFLGLIDEVRIWNRTIGLEEVQYNWDRLLHSTKDASLVLHLPFNEGYNSYEKATGATAWTTVSYAHEGTLDLHLPITSTDTLPWVQVDGRYDFYKFDGDNIIANSTTFKKRGASNIPTIVEVTYTDTAQKPWRDNYAEVRQVPMTKERYSRVPMPGITRYSQAVREATERYNNIVSDSTVVFSALDDTLNLKVGDGIQFHHPTIEATDTSFFKPYRITNLKQRDAGRWDIGAIEYDPLNYSIEVATDSTFPDTNLPKVTEPIAPSSLLLTEVLRQTQNGGWTSRIKGTFLPPDYIYVRDFRVLLFDSTDTKLEEIHIRNAPGGDGRVTYLSSPTLNLINGSNLNYYVKIYTISVVGVQSSELREDILLKGKELKPGDVTSLTGFEAGGKVYLRWNNAIDIDIWRYEIRESDTSVTSWSSTTLVDRVDALTYTALNMPLGYRRFYVKAIDSVGGYSLNAATVVVYVDSDEDYLLLDNLSVVADVTACSNVSFYTIRPDQKTYAITDHGGTWNTDSDVLTSPMDTTPWNTQTIPVPHATAVSSWVSTQGDFGSPGGGNFYSGNIALTMDYTILEGAASVLLYHSTDGTAWTTVTGTSTVATARFVYAEILTDGDPNSAFVLNNEVFIRFDVVTKEERGIAVTNATDDPSHTLARVSLARVYTVYKNIQLTSQGATPYYVAYEDLLLGSGNSPNTFDIYAISSSLVETAGVTVSWIFKGV